MRIRALSLPRFKNFRDFRVGFNTASIVTVLLGWNGTGKSNLLEAIVCIFRDLDLGESPAFPYTIEYECRGHEVRVEAASTDKKSVVITVDGDAVSFSKFTSEDGAEYRPGHVFGYYSGPSARLEHHFAKHQERFYRDLLKSRERPLRRLFFARPVHSQFVLLSFFCRPEESHQKFLKELLGIEAFDSVLFVLREPPWATNKPNPTVKAEGDDRFWFARGVVKGFLDQLYTLALAPLRLEQRVEIEFRKAGVREHVYLFLKDVSVLQRLANGYSTTADFFKTLESTYISNLLAETRIRVRIKGADGTLTFRELSEGEQQLLTVLGLLEFTKEKESLFLLDEPDTHLNPKWSMDYVKLLRGLVQETDNSQILMATHDPVVIGALKKEQVLVLQRDEIKRAIIAEPPELDPQGLGIAGILTSEMFGLGSTIDEPTLQKINRRIQLHASRDTWTDEERREYDQLSDELARLGFNREFSDPYFEQFAAAIARRHEATVKKLSPDKQKELDAFADDVLAEITKENSS